jgi:hypothetical protein
VKVIALDLWEDLRSRRLLPVAIGLVIAIVAVPILLLASGSEEPEAPPAATSDAPADPEVAHLTETPLGGSSKLNRFKARDPFAGGPGAGDLSAGGGFDAAAAAAGGGASIAVGAAGAGLGTTSDTGDTATASVDTATASSSGGSVAPSSDGGAGSNSGGRDGGRNGDGPGRGGDGNGNGNGNGPGNGPPTEPEPPEEPEPPTEPPPTEPPPEEPPPAEPEIEYRANVAFGQIEDVDNPAGEDPDRVDCESPDEELVCYRPLDPGSFLPEETEGQEPLLYFVGLADNEDGSINKEAVFVILTEGAIVDGEACFKGDCRLISVDENDPTRILRVVVGPGEDTVLGTDDDVFNRYRLELLGVDEVHLNPPGE